MNHAWRFTLKILATLLLNACSTMHIPIPGPEDSIPVRPKQAKLSLGAGKNKALDFNTFAQTGDKSSIDYADILSPILGGSIGLTDEMEVSLTSYSPVPFPSMVGLKYQIIGAIDDTRPLSGSISLRYGFTSFGGLKKYTESGSTCNSSDACAADPNSKMVSGQASSYSFGFPHGYRMSKTFRFVLVPQVTYFDGWYTRHNRVSPENETDTEFSLNGLRKTIGFNGFYRLTPALSGAVSCQFHNDSWSGIEGEQSLSIFLGISYLGGDLEHDLGPVPITRPPIEL